MKNKLYLGSGIWEKKDWYNHHTSKSIWYNNITNIKSSKNIGELNNIDNTFKFDIDLDLTDKKKIMLDDNSLEAVYTSHMIEHIKNDQAKFLFKDVYRLLKPNGVFRITCPDIEILYTELIINKNVNVNIGSHTNNLSLYDKFIHQISSYLGGWYLNNKSLVDKDIYQEFLNIPKIDENEFNNLLKIYGKYGTFEYLRKLSEKYFDKYKYHLTGLHINWWNHQKVIHFLIDAGFTKIFIRKQNESILDDFKSNDFDYNSPNISLYIEAIK